MTLRRGFKSEANEYAREYREELELPHWNPLCPWALAKHLGIPVLRLSFLKSGARAEVEYLMRNGRDYFSAVTVFSGFRRAILHNDGNAKTRQAADIAHEIAHAVLGHPPESLFDETGKRKINARVEAEAKWLGPALLVSEEAALLIARSGRSVAEAAEEYGVSEALMQMRLNVTGARRRTTQRRRGP
jgi:Zn-dependent peptidase ImmA (M78 family)